MDHVLSIPSNIKAWTKIAVARYGLSAGRRLGQHFLIDKSVLQDILKTAAISPQTPVLEVGGGLGVLTLALLSQAERVVVVELDEKLCQALNKIGMGSSKLKLVKGDILKITNEQLQLGLGIKKNEPWQIVANLPYEISGAFLQRFLWGDFLPQAMTLLLQREVAERMMAPPGQMSLLSLSCQLKSQVRIIRHIKPSSFWPEPRVQSSLVRLDLFSDSDMDRLLDDKARQLLWRLARISFAARRKVMINNLKSALELSRDELEKIFIKAVIPLKARAQELSIDDWFRLTKEVQQVL